MAKEYPPTDFTRSKLASIIVEDLELELLIGWAETGLIMFYEQNPDQYIEDFKDFIEEDYTEEEIALMFTPSVEEEQE